MTGPQQFESIFARNCVIQTIPKEMAQEFLQKNHCYGSASCRFRYGLFQVRGKMPSGGNDAKGGGNGTTVGRLVAVATFSSARKWLKEGREYRSYEWVRYASLEGTRVIGGMSKLLKNFVETVKPDDVMTYAPEEKFTGEVYTHLGFVQEEKKIFPDGNASLKFRYRPVSNSKEHHSAKRD